MDDVWIAAMLITSSRAASAGAVRSDPSAVSRSHEMRSFYKSPSAETQRCKGAVRTGLSDQSGPSSFSFANLSSSMGPTNFKTCLRERLRVEIRGARILNAL